VPQPRFLADEDLRFEIVLAARRLEPTIHFPTVVELGRAGASDEDQLEFARRAGRILVSHDVNTLRKLAEDRIADGRGVGGVLLTAQRNPTREVAETIVLIFAASDATEWVNRVVFVPF
jgi:hypothetical protein